MRLPATLTAPLLVAGALVALSPPASAATVTASAAPMSPEACLARPSSAISALTGSLTGTQGSRAAESDRTWDLRGFSHTANPAPTRYPFKLDAAKRACVLGGSVIGNIPRDWPRSAWYHGTDTSAEWDGEGYRLSQTPDSPWLYQHGSYVENVSDGFDPNGVANGVNHTYLDRVHAKFVRDDCVEVEGDGFSPHSLTITDSLFDGCHNFLSMRPSGTSHADAGTTPGRLTIEDSLAWVQPMPLSATDCENQPTHCPGGLGNHVLFKWSSAAVNEVVVRNTVFRVDQPSAFSIRGMHWPAGTYENVTLVWTWPRPHTDYFQVPPGVRVVNDVRVWDAAKAAWAAGAGTVTPEKAQAPSAPVNAAPVVSAGPDVSVVAPGTASLAGKVTDDGMPSSTVSLEWKQVSGPGRTAFASPRAAATTASFDVTGTYVLRLTASDGTSTSADDVTVSVKRPARTIVDSLQQSRPTTSTTPLSSTAPSRQALSPWTTSRSPLQLLERARLRYARG